MNAHSWITYFNADQSPWLFCVIGPNCRKRMDHWRILFVSTLLGVVTQLGWAQQTEPILPQLNRVEWTDTTQQLVIATPEITAEGWDTLASIRFWKSIMQLEPELSILNVAKTRQILEKVDSKPWLKQDDATKEAYRDSLRQYYCLDNDARIFLTTGKSDFYNFEKALPAIDRGVAVFIHEQTDPWYAQSILLIESPGRLEKSPVGALGSFQLMRGVARQMGLTVNKYQDDRKDFDKSAVGAARLLRTICIPETRKLLDRHQISYCEDDLWFRLLVLHVYHAGAANVSGVLKVIDPDEGGMQLIQTLWVTESGRFRNASQNYSQVALASLLCLEELIARRCIDVCDYPTIPVAVPPVKPPETDENTLATE